MKNNDKYISAEEIKYRLNYCPETGIFTRARAVAPNAQLGSACGRPNTNGHIQITIRQRKYMAHRVAWLIMTGDWPKNEIDHINRDPSDNRWANLREATHSQNMINRSRKRKYDLPRGVSQAGRRFQSQIKIDDRFMHLGMFGCPTAAHLAWLRAAHRRGSEFLPQMRAGR